MMKNVSTISTFSCEGNDIYHKILNVSQIEIKAIIEQGKMR